MMIFFRVATGPVGVLTGGLIYKNFGFTAVFATSATLFFGSFIYGFFVIREEVSELASGRNCCADMVNIKAVKDMLATVFLRRSGLQRRYLMWYYYMICGIIKIKDGPANFLTTFLSLQMASADVTYNFLTNFCAVWLHSKHVLIHEKES